MAKKRLNVSEVAEVLFDEIGEFKAESSRLTQSIEKLRTYKVSISDESIEKYNMINNETKDNIELFKELMNEKQKFIPRWAYILMFVAFAITGFSILVTIIIFKMATS